MIDYRQDTLFGKKIISTLGFNEQEIIRDILYLHAKDKPIDLDPTYSIGNFYKKGLSKPIHKFDKYPQLPEVKYAVAENIPLEDQSCEVIIFDPPFVMGGQNYENTKDDSCIIAKRFSSFADWNELKDMYSGSLKEFYRLLKSGGIVIFKCQDTVSGGKNYFTHSWVMQTAVDIGFYAKDLFILLSKTRITDNRVQQHARKYHSYFWVFEKSTTKVDYK